MTTGFWVDATETEQRGLGTMSRGTGRDVRVQGVEGVRCAVTESVRRGQQSNP